MSFFKIPVSRLCERLPKPVTFNEAQTSMVDGLESHRFFVTISARRTGKSYAAAILAFAKLLEPSQQSYGGCTKLFIVLNNMGLCYRFN